MSESALVLGASSAIGRAIARRLASQGVSLVLAGRRLEELERCARDLEVRYGVEVAVECYEALDFDSHAELFETCAKRFDAGLDGVVLCHGVMAEQEDAERDFATARHMIDVNYSSAVSLLGLAADYLARRGQGWICGISSVAGDRGRPSNFLYGSTKAALDTYLGGLRARLAPAGVRVVTIKPGFVDTGLTWGRPGLFLVATPEKVAADTLRAIRRDRAVRYTPRFWALALWLIRHIPDPIFKRLRL